MRIIASDSMARNQNSGSVFLALIEKWLNSLGVKSKQAPSRQSSLAGVPTPKVLRPCPLLRMDQ